LGPTDCWNLTSLSRAISLDPDGRTGTRTAATGAARLGLRPIAAARG